MVEDKAQLIVNDIKNEWGANPVDMAKELGFKEVTFTTKPEVMKVGYELYKRLGFEEVGEKDGVVSMRMGL